MKIDGFKLKSILIIILSIILFNNLTSLKLLSRDDKKETNITQDEVNKASPINDTKKIESKPIKTLNKEDDKISGIIKDRFNVSNNCKITNISMSKGSPILNFKMRLESEKDELIVLSIPKRINNQYSINGDLVHVDENNNGFNWYKNPNIKEEKFIKFRHAFSYCRKINNENLDNGLYDNLTDENNLKNLEKKANENNSTVKFRITQTLPEGISIKSNE